MPSINNVVLTDRAGTPVNHTFTPLGRESDGARYSKAGASPLGDYTFSIIPRRTPTGRRKVDLSLSLPVLVTEVINGVNVYSVSRTNRGKVSLDIDSAATLQERKDLMGMLYTALATATTQVNDTVVNGEMVW